MTPIKVLFVCHGNICRSPMGEFILKELVRKAGMGEAFEIASAATSREEIGNDIYPPAKRMMREKGIPFDSRRARQVAVSDMEHFDYVLIMDDNNARNLHRMFGSAFDSKIYKLMSFCGSQDDVSDPWYTGDFSKAYDDILSGCEAFLRRCGF